jgi:hypothetical protein
MRLRRRARRRRLDLMRRAHTFKPIHHHWIANVFALESLQRGLPPRSRYGEETLCADRFDAIVRVAMRERVET